MYDTYNNNHCLPQFPFGSPSPCGPDKAADRCNDQIPVISQVGRGLQGDSYKVRVVDPDTISSTYLEGLRYDAASKTWSSEWMSENINGGHLSYFYNLRPYTIPQCFTITFVYRRDNRPEWSWTTPAIPYIWDADGDGKPDVDQLIGSGVGNLWIREGINAEWKEKLVFPDGTTAADFNAPGPLETWSGNITFGWGGDIELPNLDDIAKILGWDREDIEKVLDGIEGALSGSDNVKGYIDDRDNEIKEALNDGLTQVYIDMGFGDPIFNITIKQYIDNLISELDDKNTIINNLIKEIINKINGGGTINIDGSITWPTTDKIATGNINVTSGGFTSANGIWTRAAQNNNDLDFQ